MGSATFSDMAFAATVFLSSLVTMACFMPPLWKEMRLQEFTASELRAARIRRAIVLALGAYHGVLALRGGDQQPPSAVCRYPEHLNADLFRWNGYTATWLASLIAAWGPLRLAAVRTLGAADFVGAPTPPRELVTRGVYGYVQHPGYVGQVMMLATNMAVLFRWDGAAGCWIPGSFLGDVRGLGLLSSAMVMYALVHGVPRHIAREETLLREAFGPKWEAWSAETARFIPWVW
ncbi:hypothetical protein B0I35DRAFT_423453 [Stachybotrys elegans]|uniref:Protein-S-isoprenylcysteine O-methyltransferase n=1 Tax=Stachybotrys elegans TaxID=80388 RepID=A0A8K0WVJ0_9HYPO|nr:hypothetical protein B0I35DRAFT_423453 [Stachybotrys elegans]